jgi:hypothetical protein
LLPKLEQKVPQIFSNLNKKIYFIKYLPITTDSDLENIFDNCIPFDNSISQTIHNILNNKLFNKLFIKILIILKLILM